MTPERLQQCFDFLTKIKDKIMERKVIIAGNWKMNKDAAAGKELVESLKGLVADVTEAEIVVCPPFTTLSAVVAAAASAAEKKVVAMPEMKSASSSNRTKNRKEL